MVKNKLYTVNRWNKRLFDWGGLASKDKVANPWDYADDMDVTQQYMNSKNIFGISKADNPFSKGNLSEAFSGKGLNNTLSAAAPSLISSGANMVGSFAGNAISGGLESGAGNAIGSIGSTVGGAVGAVNPVLGAVVSVGSQVVGGLVNRAFGTKVNQANLRAANEGTSAYNNFQSNADYFDDITGPVAQANVQDAYSGGWFSSAGARRKNERLKRQREEARSFAFRSVGNNTDNLVKDQQNNALANFSAFGGPIDSLDMGAIKYNFISDYLNTKKQEAIQKEKTANINPAPAFMPQRDLFAIGGDLQTHGADWSDGMMTIGAGGSHSENPNEGVQIGIDNEGIPNLVEEGETIFNDYVYSNRILADETTKKMFGLSKKQKSTFADISKKLEKEISERPNDPISKAGFEKKMADLAEQQERQKEEMETARAKEAFEALSPEEQSAVIAQVASQMSSAPQQPIQQMQQPLSEEEGLPQRQQEYNVGQEPQMFAEGGRVNRFDTGGKAYIRLLNTLGFHTQKEFDTWAEENGIDLSKVWKDDNRVLNNSILNSLWKDDNFKKALQKKNPALAHAFIEKGYDFGAYQPGRNNKATVQSINRGNWKATDGKGWKGSDDLAFKQATEGLSDAEIDALTTEQLAERLRNTDAYQNTNKWLQNSDNALLYLNTLLDDPNTPQEAKDYAAKYVRDGKWRNGFNYDYATVFGSNGKGVREANPGTYWHTALEANRNNQIDNFVINDDGSVEPIIGEVPVDWSPAGNYAWADEGNDYAYNYYRRPVVAASTPPVTSAESGDSDDKGELVPTHKAEWLRYAGLFGPAVGLGMQMSGIGKPNTKAIDAAVNNMGAVATPDYKPLGNYLTYRPLDRLFKQNLLNAESRATDRQIMNSGINPGAKMAGLLANGYNSQIASGNLFRQEQEYNDALRRQVAEFNRGTDMFNADAYNKNSLFTADARNRARQIDAQLKLQAATQKADIDAGWYRGIYDNLSGLFEGISNVGRENVASNWRNNLITSGAMGIVDEDALIKAGIARYKKGKACGGKIKKRGLTI